LHRKLVLGKRRREYCVVTTSICSSPFVGAIQSVVHGAGFMGRLKADILDEWLVNANKRESS
jgi:hypothetical protein